MMAPPTPGLFYLVPQLGDVAAVLQRYLWYTDLADGLNAPLDNLVNTQLFPLPQVGGAHGEWPPRTGGRRGATAERPLLQRGASRPRAVPALTVV
jgi:hypothetical protein